jgi:hypothetical protein
MHAPTQASRALCVGLLCCLTAAGCQNRAGHVPIHDAGPRDAAAPDGNASEFADAAAISDASTDSAAALIDPELPLTAWHTLSDDAWSQWYTWLPSQGRDVDGSGVFKIEDGVLHVLGGAAPDGDQEFGYMATREDFANYRLRVEQRWGTRRFAPRATVMRDSGLLYHLRGADKVWPQCVEFQIQENDVGDLFLLSDVGATSPLAPGRSDALFQEGGSPRSQRNGAVTKSSTHDSLQDWNALELIASDREFVHIVNGFVNQRGWGLEYLAGSDWSALDHGRIALQAEGAEVFYRNVQLRTLSYPKPPDDSIVLFDGSGLDAWQQRDGSAPGWRSVDGALEVAAGSGDLRTRESFGDVRLHLEFRVPATLDPDADEPTRGASGVSLQARYEVHISDAFGRTLADADDAAAIYGVRDAALNEALPAETWQSYDIVFRTARWSGDAKQKPARLTVVWNGSEVQHAVEVPASTAAGDAESPEPGPILLQDRGSAVRYRNIWLQRL